MKKKNELSSKELAEVIADGMLEKKGFDVVILDLRKIHKAITDFFVICSGSSDTQIDAIANSVDEAVHKAIQENPWHREGQQNKEWILLDYVDVVVHIFKKDRREYYDIESLWGDADIRVIQEGDVLTVK